MKLVKAIEGVAGVLAGIRLPGGKGNPKLAALDRGILTVALLLAALDGTVFPEEYAAFDALAHKCRGASAKNVRELLDRILREIGYLMVMAQVGCYSEKERLAEFLRAATLALPSGFADGTLADVRRAFALWVAIGVADGTFSGLERRALVALSDRYADARRLRAQVCVDVVAMSDPCPVEFKRPLWVKAVAVLEPDFFAKAERIARDMAIPTRREKAEAALEALVSQS